MTFVSFEERRPTTLLVVGRLLIISENKSTETVT